MVQWWRDAVIYQVYPRSFADSNGDGMGDLEGIRSKIPYLARLGVEALWLSPFYTSPQADAGYDVADYRDVDPSFGSLDDFDALCAEVHRHDIRLIVDIVPNHCSVAHEWFTAALAAGPGSAERALFHFRDSPDGPPNNWQSHFGGPAWTQVADGQWYLHLFDPGQPDFNWDHPKVRNEFHDILRFWLNRGVDGFRVDVAHGLMKAPGLPDSADASGPEQDLSIRTPYQDLDSVHEIYRGWREILDSYPGDRMAVAEAWVESPVRRMNYVRADELHQAFNFDLLMADFAAPEFRKLIDAELANSGSVNAPPTWVLSNHDRPRHVTRYGDGDLGLARARAASMLLLALPGATYLYQGEELGLPEVLDLPEEVLADPTWERSGHTVRGRDGCRVPIPWRTDGPSFGFGAAAGWLPQPSDWGQLSAEAQDGVTGSTLELYRQALRLRREHRPVSLTWKDERGPETLTFSNGSLTCVTNFGAGSVRVDGEVLMSTVDVSDGTVQGPATVWLAE